MVEELADREGLALVVDEDAQQLELERREPDRLAVDGDLASEPIHHHVRVPVDLLGRCGVEGVELAAADQRLDAGLELTHAEGLGHVVVGPGVEAADLVGLAVEGGEHQDGDVGQFADALQDRPAVHLRESDVEDDQVGGFVEEAAQAVTAVADLDDAMAPAFGDDPDGVGDLRIILDDQDQVLFGRHGRVPPSFMSSRSRGTRTVNTVPVGWLARRSMRPAWCSTILCAMAKPTPVPGTASATAPAPR